MYGDQNIIITPCKLPPSPSQMITDDKNPLVCSSAKEISIVEQEVDDGRLTLATPQDENQIILATPQDENQIIQATPMKKDYTNLGLQKRIPNINIQVCVQTTIWFIYLYIFKFLLIFYQ